MIKIDKEKCSGCGNCVEACPFGVFEIENGKAAVKHPEKCRKCRACISACPNNAIKIERDRNGKAIKWKLPRSTDDKEMSRLSPTVPPLLNFNTSMEKYCGKVYKIRKVIPDRLTYRLEIGGKHMVGFVFSDTMLHPEDYLDPEEKITLAKTKRLRDHFQSVQEFEEELL